MSDPKIISEGQTINIGSCNHLTQVQHKGDSVDIVDHLDHNGIPAHFITSVKSDGTLSENLSLE